MRDAVTVLGHAPSLSTRVRTLACEQAFVLAVLDSRNLLFGEAVQAVYELDGFSAYLWRSFTSGLTDEQIASEIAGTAGDLESAHRAIAVSAQQLLEILTAMPGGTMPVSTSAANRLTRIALELRGVAVQLNLCEPLLADVEAAFASLKCGSDDARVRVTARTAGDIVKIHVDGRPVSSCDRHEFVPFVKALLIESVLKWARYEVALHAAVLGCSAGTLLLLGSPGTGKTTLAAALVGRGFKIAADDVALLDNTCHLSGLLLPFTVKEGAWPILSADWPALATEPIYHRPDGIRVRYLQNVEFADTRTERVEFVILLDRRAGVPTSIQSIGCVTALQALIAEGDARDERLTESGFRSLVSALSDASCFRLTYSDLAEASETVSSLCREATK